MQLVHMDVSLPASHSRQLVGPLSSGLNAVVGPRGSGKTRLIRWLRQVTAETYGNDYVPATPAAVELAGEVELRNHGTPIRISRDSYGRVRTHRSHADHREQFSAATNFSTNSSFRELTARQRQTFAMLADINDTAANAEAAIDEVAHRFGLEARVEETRTNDRDLLVARERDLTTRLDSLQRLPTTREDLISRRRDIEHKLGSLRDRLAHQSYDPRLDRNRLLDRYASIEADLQGAVAELEQVDREIANVKAELKQCEIGQQTVQIEPSYREQLQQLEDRLSRWRKTLRDLKTHRESLENQETEAKLDHQVGTQLSGSLTADPRASMRSLEAQLHHARKQLDDLIGQYLPHGALRPAVDATATGLRAIDPRTLGGYQVQRDPFGRTHISYDTSAVGYDSTTLPEMLRSMQRDLHDICHQLSRQEAATAASALKQQTDQLRRAEAELLNSVEKLIEERGLLLRKIADHYNLTSDQISLTFGDWCQCNDHPHLYDWLVQEEAPRKLTREVDGPTRSKLEESLLRLNAQRREASLRAEECRRQLREANRARVSIQTRPAPDTRQAEEADLLRELDLITVQLSDMDSRDRLVAELDEVRRQMSRLPIATVSMSEYRQAVDRNIVGLCGSLYQAGAAIKSDLTTSRQYDTVNGTIFEQPMIRSNYQVPPAIVRTAQRLAIGQLLALRGDSIPVVLDQTLDGLDTQLQLAAVSHLALASQRMQIVVMTDDSHIADLVRQYRGTVVGLQQVQVKQNLDVNRQLTAFANDEEADKWYQPVVEPLPRRAHAEFYLSFNSSVEEHPGVHPNLAHRCRSLGVSTIRDLLEVDPQWLAECLRASDVSAARVSNWQAAADLLCNVRNLRPFDARILVGSGIRSASALSAMHPSDLADRVEQFMATETGRKILRSGNSHELASITNWVAAARRGSARFGQQAGYNRNGYVPAGYDRNGFDNGRNGYSDHDYPAVNVNGDVDADYAKPESWAPRVREERRSAPRTNPANDTMPRQRNDRDYPTLADSAKARSVDSGKSRNGSHSANQPVVRAAANTQAAATAKFYLDLASPIVDAPSIGDRMAEKLNAFGIYTVENFLVANAESLAHKLANRRVNGDTIKAWQDQARLVCRIPNLRGHDAQLLVACGITSPEALRGLSAEAVLNKVLAYAKSSDGQRILRGSKEPDLAEVKDWMTWASHSRGINAA